MNIQKHTSADGYSHNRVEIASIPADYSVMLDTGCVLVLDAKVRDGALKAAGVIINHAAWHDVIDHDPDARVIRLSVY